MYIKQREHQIKLDDFNQTIGLTLDPENRWVKLAQQIPWTVIEDRYAQLFPSDTGMPAKPLQTALGSLLIQRKMDLADREVVQSIIENPYMQYFIGLPGYTNEQPFAPSLMVEFRKRWNIRIDKKGMARIETISFDAYNESEVLPQAVERYKQRTGHYPERVLVDQIYRNRKNISFCKERGIRISGPALGRRGKNYKTNKKTEYQDNADRIEVERGFSLAKRRYGLGKNMCKLPVTTKGAISLAILIMNLDRIAAIFLSKTGLRLFFSFICRMMNSTVAQKKLLAFAG